MAREDREPSWPVALAVWALLILCMWATGAFAQVPTEASRYQRDMVRQARVVWGIDAPVAVFAGQIHQESGWNPLARSPVGATGMAQFMPSTATWICGRYSDLPAGCDTLSPVWAMRALVRYDRHLYDRLAWAGGECARMWFALRAYNGGEGHLLKEARLAADPKDRDGVDAQCGRASRSIKHCPENLGYPRRIIERHQPKYLGWGRGVCS